MVFTPKGSHLVAVLTSGNLCVTNLTDEQTNQVERRLTGAMVTNVFLLLFRRYSVPFLTPLLAPSCSESIFNVICGEWNASEGDPLMIKCEAV